MRPFHNTLVSSTLFVSSGEIEQCCHEHEVGPRGPKGEAGSPGKSHYKNVKKFILKNKKIYIYMTIFLEKSNILI